MTLDALNQNNVWCLNLWYWPLTKTSFGLGDAVAAPGPFRKLSFSTERASERPTESETDEPELDISSRAAALWHWTHKGTVTRGKREAGTGRQAGREGVDFMSLCKPIRKHISRILLLFFS